MTWPSVKVHQAVNCNIDELSLNKITGIVLTTLAARATTSKSEERESNVTLRHAIKAGDSKDMSRRHSTARARKMESVMSKDLVERYI